LIAAGKADCPAEAATLAAKAIDNGAAKAILEKLAATTNAM
jgi:anthranilate phosphoribosyltransferase